MANQAPIFGARPPAAPRKPWQLPVGAKDKRKRGRAGQRDRAEVMAEEPLCRQCLKFNRTSPSEVVDHIIPLSEGGSDARSNKQGLCTPCHDAKSKAERARAARARAAR